MGNDPFDDPDMPVDEVMRRWPAAIGVMMRHRFLCVGCPIGPFHTVTDACHAHGADERAFRSELARAIEIGEGTGSGDSSQAQASTDTDA